MSTVTDYLQLAAAGSGLVHAASGYYIQLRSKTGGGTYTSTAVTDSTGFYTLTGIPPDDYEIWYSTSASGPWTDSRQTQHVPVSRPWIDVVSLGADPTGVADSRAAIQAALTAVPTAGGIVFFPAGTYRVSDYVQANDNTTISGPGVIRAGNATNMANGILYLGNNCVVRDVTVDGNRTNQTSGGAVGIIQTVAKVGTRIINATINNAWDRGIYHYQGSDHLIEGCSFNNCGTTNTGGGNNCAILMYTATRVRIANNSFYNSACVHVSLGDIGSTHVVIEGNLCWNAGFIGIGLANGSSHVAVVGNRITHNGTAGCIDIGSVTDAVISNNDCNGGTGGIVNLPPSYNVAIVGNRLRDHIGGGIYLGGDITPARVNTVINSNVISGCTGYGMSVPYAYNVTIANNVVMDNGTNTGYNAANRSGIFIYGDATGGYPHNVIITGNRCGDNQATKTQTYGVYITGPSSANVLVSNNDLIGNLTGAVFSDVTGGGAKFRGNSGYNPVGSFTAPTFPATGVASAPQSYDASVWIKSGTNAITAIAIGGTTVTVGGTNVTIAAGGAIGGPFRVPAGQTVTLTYTAGGTPAWTWFGD